MRLKDKVAIVTGSASGIGPSISAYVRRRKWSLKWGRKEALQ
jgi:NAD(P)-dependent dehydrogenase (short-subunit alcohol dehydrogenase family)